ncbi:hypothetical protein [uncultured Flavobacterium sp.]|uniref:hypothetical protein n=1 Tax=uncultured Flavobacterium sp. TaxID=165435 RepID=UPI0025F1A6EE|nr:hypothetical protein [uncultured Flavobacterium sp.]
MEATGFLEPLIGGARSLPIMQFRKNAGRLAVKDKKNSKPPCWRKRLAGAKNSLDKRQTCININFIIRKINLILGAFFIANCIFHAKSKYLFLIMILYSQ